MCVNTQLNNKTFSGTGGSGPDDVPGGNRDNQQSQGGGEEAAGSEGAEGHEPEGKAKSHTSFKLPQLNKPFMTQQYSQ